MRFYTTHYWPEVLEALLVLAAWVLAERFPGLAQPQFEAAEAWLKRLAQRKGRSILVAAAFPMTVRLLLLPVMPFPSPVIHDEFSHLLVADTFAHGRIANPPNPHWEFFESFHILHHPTYASMEPPAPGLFLAFGEKLLGHPWFGVWVGMGLLCGALCWALQQWLPPQWALAGALLAGMRWGIFSYWMNSYWGGSVAALGGALLVGSAAAVVRKPEVRPALLLGLAWSLLAASRPLEGLLVSIPVVVYLAVHFLSSEDAWFIRAVVPAGLVLAAGISALAVYNAKVTGNPLLMPNQANRKEYAQLPYFVWQKEQTGPAYRHQVMRLFYADAELGSARNARQHPIGNVFQELRAHATFYEGAALLIPLAAAIWWRKRLPGSALLISVVAIPWISQTITNTGFLAHYHAPVLGALMVLVVSGLMALRSAGPGGLFLSRAIPAICAGMLLVALALQFGDFSSLPYPWYGKAMENTFRTALIDSLKGAGGKHLIFVSYAPDHNIMVEWVYNDADLMNAPIVWARDMGPEKNAELIRDSGDRTVWTLEPDRDARELLPYGAKKSLIP